RITTTRPSARAANANTKPGLRMIISLSWTDSAGAAGHRAGACPGSPDHDAAPPAQGGLPATAAVRHASPAHGPPDCFHRPACPAAAAAGAGSPARGAG